MDVTQGMVCGYGGLMSCPNCGSEEIYIRKERYLDEMTMIAEVACPDCGAVFEETWVAAVWEQTKETLSWQEAEELKQLRECIDVSQCFSKHDLLRREQLEKKVREAQV